MTDMEKAISSVMESIVKHEKESTDWFSAVRAEMKTETEKKLVEWAIIDLTSKRGYLR